MRYIANNIKGVFDFHRMLFYSLNWKLYERTIFILLNNILKYIFIAIFNIFYDESNPSIIKKPYINMV